MVLWSFSDYPEGKWACAYASYLVNSLIYTVFPLARHNVCFGEAEIHFQITVCVLYVFYLIWVHLQKGKMVREKIKTGQHMTNWKLKGALGFPDWKIQNECEQWIVV